MAEEYNSQFSGREIDERLQKAGAAICYTEQTLTEDQKAQARENIDALSSDDVKVTAENIEAALGYTPANPAAIPSEIHIGPDEPTDPAVKLWFDTDEDPDDDPDEGSGSSIDVTAEVGQTIVVEAVDESGKPTKWKAVDFPETAQSDWNAAEGEPGHILNRTHYENGTETKTLLDTTVTVANNQYMSVGYVPIAAGNTYTVTWDGTEYECVAFEAVFSGVTAPAFGNPYFFGGTDNGMPFMFMSSEAQGGFGGAAMTNGSHTIKITGEVKVYKKLDDCYLPLSARTYVIKLLKGDTTSLVGGIRLSRISYDEFADILWAGGNVLLDVTDIYGSAGLCQRSRAIRWLFLDGVLGVSFAISDIASGDQGERTQLNFNIEFTVGTWTPPEA